MQQDNMSAYTWIAVPSGVSVTEWRYILREVAAQQGTSVSALILAVLMAQPDISKLVSEKVKKAQEAK